MGRVIKYVLAGIVLSALLTPILGVGITIYVYHVRRDRCPQR